MSVISLRIKEHRDAAVRAGLLYVTDGIAGIRRQRVGKGWTFFAPDGERIRDPLARRADRVAGDSSCLEQRLDLSGSRAATSR